MQGSRTQALCISLVVQGLGLHTSNAGDPGSIPGQGTLSQVPKLKVCTPQLGIPPATVKIEDPACRN